ncbi:MAG: FecR domain-containing protein [Planctomycetaceae bacterium]|nr:FecR domain-containing protein [Planctomycetaceae bacterium]
MNDNVDSRADERTVLLNGLADDLLTPEQEQHLADLLRTDAGFRREYVRFCQLQTQLMWVSAMVSEPGTTLTAPVDLVVEPRAGRQKWRGRFMTWTTLVGVVAVAIAIGLVRTKPEPLTKVPIGVIASVQGRVRVLRDGEPPLEVSPASLSQSGWPLEPGDRLQTEFLESAAVVLADQTRLVIGPRTILSLSEKSDNQVRLASGRITANVAPRSADHPLTFVTREATVHVLGTRLELLAVPERTDVAVTEGKVRVTRTADEATADVGAAQFVAVTFTGPLPVIDWPLAPDLWSEDFENGLPPGWSGRMVREGLPSGSRGAVEAVALSGSRGRLVAAASPLRKQGLFAWHADTVLHLTYRVPPPAWFHINLLVRSYHRPEPLRAWCRVDPELWQTKPGEWRTASIPLSEFQFSGVELSGEELGRIPVQLSFSGPVDFPGVVIDEVRVDRSNRLPWDDSPSE